MFGGSVHAALQAYYDARMEGRCLDAAELLDAYRGAWADGRDQQIPVRYGRGENTGKLDGLAGRVFDSFLGSPVSSPEGQIVVVEDVMRARIDAALPDVVARVDLAWQGDDALHLVDFKTARSRWSADHVAELAEQLLLYASLARTLIADGPIATHFAVLTKTRRPLVQLLDVPFDSGRVRAMIQTMRSVWSAITAGQFYPSPSSINCATCPFQPHCPAWPGG